MRKYLFTTILLSFLTFVARGQEPQTLESLVDLSGLPEATTAASLRYWFDADAGSVQTTTTLSGATTIDASALAEGIHVVHYQAIDNKGVASIPASALFFKVGDELAGASLRYWFDTDLASAQTTTTLSGATTIDASALTEGVHVVYFQTIDNMGVAGIPVSAMFIKTASQAATPVPTTIRYWFDQDYDNRQEAGIANLTMTIDASKLTKGSHELHYQLVMDDGSVSPVSTRSFTNIMIMKGDANNDRKVNATDIVEIVKYIQQNPSANFDEENANVIVDEEIDLQDVQAVKIIILNAE